MCVTFVFFFYFIFQDKASELTDETKDLLLQYNNVVSFI